MVVPSVQQSLQRLGAFVFCRRLELLLFFQQQPHRLDQLVVGFNIQHFLQNLVHFCQDVVHLWDRLFGGPGIVLLLAEGVV